MIFARLLAFFLAFCLPFLGAVGNAAADPLWVGSPAAKARTEAFLAALRGAAAHGLEPGWYGLAELETAVGERQQAEAERDQIRTELAARMHASENSPWRKLRAFLIRSRSRWRDDGRPASD